MIRADLQKFEETCRERGLKLTHQRVEVYRAVHAARNHPSAEDVYEAVRAQIPTISLDTVYRTMETFAELGIVRKFAGPDGRNRFDTNLHAHQHLVCTRCGRLEDIDWHALEDLPLPRVPGWSDLEVVEVEIRGQCKACRGKK